jgi:hypothetical protein
MVLGRSRFLINPTILVSLHFETEETRVQKGSLTLSEI